MLSETQLPSNGNKLMVDNNIVKPKKHKINECR
jgi:hypothetical protein